MVLCFGNQEKVGKEREIKMYGFKLDLTFLDFNSVGICHIMLVDSVFTRIRFWDILELHQTSSKAYNIIVKTFEFENKFNNNDKMNYQLFKIITNYLKISNKARVKQ